jgi:hypothetical protein
MIIPQGPLTLSLFRLAGADFAGCQRPASGVTRKAGVAHDLVFAPARLSSGS